MVLRRKGAKNSPQKSQERNLSEARSDESARNSLEQHEEDIICRPQGLKPRKHNEAAHETESTRHESETRKAWSRGKSLKQDVEEARSGRK